MTFASYLIRVRCDPQMLSTKLLCFWINSPWGREWARRVRTDGVSQSNINSHKLGALPVPLPPVEEQREIVRRVESFFKLADAIEKRVAAAMARAEKLTQSILAKAFRGELVPTEAELARRDGRTYEPASALLGRIKSGENSPVTAKQMSFPLHGKSVRKKRRAMVT
jgi:Type I restriction modification DNA specificity domain